MITGRGCKNDRIRDLRAVLQWKDLPLLKIDITEGNVKSLELLVEHDSSYLPLIFKWKRVTYDNLNYFLESRLLPKTRQDLNNTLKRLNLPKYSWEGLIEKTYGLNTDDCYWFKPLGSSLTYNDIKLRD